MIGIVDYGLGNVKAFAHVYAGLNIPFRIAQSAADLQGVSRVILPGVGSFDQAMQRLSQSGMRETLDELVLGKKLPVLGVCVGLQMLMRSSEEGDLPGLGWLDGEVLKFRQPEDGRSLRIPHMGWNNVRPARPAALFNGLDESSLFYFLHSYFVRCNRPDSVLALADHGGEFACAASDANIFGVQFHPEKSHQFGTSLLKNFADL